MRYEKRYVQFNDLVFDHVDMISPDDLTVSYKRNDTEYTYKHGSFVPHRTRGMLVQASSFSMTIVLRMKKLPCEYRKFYADFAKTQLNQLGRLWAVSNNTLMWAWAELQSFGEAVSPKRDTLEFDVDIYLPEGVWHKADPKKTFLQPWDICDFMNCYGYKDIGSCDCCTTCGEVEDQGCICCDCNGITEDMALCHHLDDLQGYYTCSVEYHIVYDCEAAERLFDSVSKYQGQKICTDNGLISGLLYSNTDLESDYVKITLRGHVSNPRITINGNTNQIMGEYDNLIINPDGTVEYWEDGSTCREVADVDVWKVLRDEDMFYGWKIHPGNNRIMIETDNCCGPVCAFFELDPITV